MSHHVGSWPLTSIYSPNAMPWRTRERRVASLHQVTVLIFSHDHIAPINIAQSGSTTPTNRSSFVLQIPNDQFFSAPQNETQSNRRPRRTRTCTTQPEQSLAEKEPSYNQMAIE